MSGICGLFNIDDAPVAESDLRAMTAMLKRRGPEGTGRWREGRNGLGNTLLATTPELLFEKQPLTHSETGCVITADVRLDNRSELANALGLQQSLDSTGDAELILLAYLTRGAQCVDQLLGDFAFSIWDPRHQMLFCARDHFGMRPFYYHHAPGGIFVFASDARAILVLPRVPYQISEGRIADFLVPQLEWIDYTSTFYEDVFRLPPGHKLSITPSGLRIAEYWKPEPGPDAGSISDDDYAQGFLEVFTQAVDARLRTPVGKVGSMLSGGMDSGSVVAIGKDILSAGGKGPLPTFSAARRRDADCTESQAIYAALTMPSILPTLVHPDELPGLFEPIAMTYAEPFDGEFTILKAIYVAAHNHGQNVVLDGGAGDTVLAEGSYIVRLLRQGKLRLAFAEIAGEQKFWGWQPLPMSVFRYARSAFVPEPVKARLRSLLQQFSSDRFLDESLISSDFAKSVFIESRREELQHMFPGTWTSDYAVERCNAIRPNVTGGRERYARIAASLGVEARDPFLDKRVVEFCARLPGRARLRNGWPKMILRDLMKDRLPEEVRWCGGKPHLGGLFNETVTRHAVRLGVLDVTGLHSALKPYVDAAALDKAWQAFSKGGDAEPIHSANVLARWLQETASRPVVHELWFGYSDHL